MSLNSTWNYGGFCNEVPSIDHGSLLFTHGQKSRTSSLVRLTFRLSHNDLHRWFSWWFPAQIVCKDRVVKYVEVYSQIKAAVQKYCENEKWRRNIYGTSFRTRGFWENLEDFWPRYCRAMKRNCNCVTCRPFFSGLSCFLTAERKGKFTCWRSDF